MLPQSIFAILMAMLADGAPTSVGSTSNTTKPRPPAWTSWQPSRGFMKHVSESAPTDMPAEVLMEDIQSNYTIAARARIQRLNGECSESTALVRKEWGTLPSRDRQAFISACECLSGLPARTTSDIAPGAKSRWDDFTVAHIINTQEIHFSAWLLPWHRHFIWEMEQALRNECQYDGALPYWDWSKYADVPLSQNPVFDGSATSLSGNGTAISSNCSVVESGPLANWTIHLGPVAQPDSPCTVNARVDGLAYNPRPLERTFTAAQDANFRKTVSYQNVTNVILKYSDPALFNFRIDNGTQGLHGPPHLYIGGGESDTYASPGDPAFFLHHTMLDRVWSLWQSYDFDVRESDLGNTAAFDDTLRGPVFGWAPAPHVDLDSTLYMSPVFENSTAGESMSTMKYKYCYVYG